MRLLVVRHGESTNNVVMEAIFDRKDLSPQEADRLWLESRTSDPDLSDIGQREAQDFGSYYARMFKASGARPRVYVSPFLRTLGTAKPLCEAMGVGAIVQPDIYETGGVFTTDLKTKARSGPGKNLSAAEISRIFPSYDVSRLRPEGQWYTGGFETQIEARARAARVAQWLRSAALHQEVGDDVMVMVVHASFISMLFAELLRGEAEQILHGCTGAVMPNTGTTLMEMQSEGTVTVHWMGGLDHVSPLRAQESIVSTFKKTGSAAKAREARIKVITQGGAGAARTDTATARI